jgi:MerR family transcriptional regulator/heat shock protein HspR
MNTINAGIYVMQVASKLTGMHPQTLRKYERAGFLAPSRHYMVRMYSDEDIARLRTIKHLVDEVGLNLAGIEMALNLRERILEMKEDIVSSNITTGLVKQLDESLDEMLEMLGVG